MVKKSDLHPCFSCTLPDCDEGDKNCNLRRAMRVYSNAIKHRQPVTDVMRAKNTFAYQELYAPQRNQMRERLERQAREQQQAGSNAQ